MALRPSSEKMIYMTFAPCDIAVGVAVTLAFTSSTVLASLSFLKRRNEDGYRTVHVGRCLIVHAGAALAVVHDWLSWRHDVQLCLGLWVVQVVAAMLLFPGMIYKHMAYYTHVTGLNSTALSVGGVIGGMFYLVLGGYRCGTATAERCPDMSPYFASVGFLMMALTAVVNYRKLVAPSTSKNRISPEIVGHDYGTSAAGGVEQHHNARGGAIAALNEDLPNMSIGGGVVCPLPTGLRRAILFEWVLLFLWLVITGTFQVLVRNDDSMIIGPVLLLASTLLFHCSGAAFVAAAIHARRDYFGRSADSNAGGGEQSKQHSQWMLSDAGGNGGGTGGATTAGPSSRVASMQREDAAAATSVTRKQRLGDFRRLKQLILDGDQRSLALLERQLTAAINASRDDRRRTLLHYACGAGKYNIVELLAQCEGADPVGVDDSGLAPLHYLVLGARALQDPDEEQRVAARLSDQGGGLRGDIVDILTAAGANVNQCCQDGRTALHLAMQTHRQSLFPLFEVAPDVGVFGALLKAGASPLIVSTPRGGAAAATSNVGTTGGGAVAGWTEADLNAGWLHHHSGSHIGIATGKSSVVLAAELNLDKRTRDMLDHLLRQMSTYHHASAGGGVPPGGSATYGMSGPAMSALAVGHGGGGGHHSTPVALHGTLYCEACQHLPLIHIAIAADAPSIVRLLLSQFQQHHHSAGGSALSVHTDGGGGVPLHPSSGVAPYLLATNDQGLSVFHVMAVKGAVGPLWEVVNHYFSTAWYQPPAPLALQTPMSMLAPGPAFPPASGTAHSSRPFLTASMHTSTLTLAASRTSRPTTPGLAAQVPPSNSRPQGAFLVTPELSALPPMAVGQHGGGLDSHSVEESCSPGPWASRFFATPQGRTLAAPSTVTAGASRPALRDVEASGSASPNTTPPAALHVVRWVACKSPPQQQQDASNPHTNATIISPARPLPPAAHPTLVHDGVGGGSDDEDADVDGGHHAASTATIGGDLKDVSTSHLGEDPAARSGDSGEALVGDDHHLRGGGTQAAPIFVLSTSTSPPPSSCFGMSPSAFTAVTAGYAPWMTLGEALDVVAAAARRLQPPTATSGSSTSVGGGGMAPVPSTLASVRSVLGNATAGSHAAGGGLPAGGGLMTTHGAASFPSTAFSFLSSRERFKEAVPSLTLEMAQLIRSFVLQGFAVSGGATSSHSHAEHNTLHPPRNAHHTAAATAGGHNPAPVASTQATAAPMFPPAAAVVAAPFLRVPEQRRAMQRLLVALKVLVAHKFAGLLTRAPPASRGPPPAPGHQRSTSGKSGVMQRSAGGTNTPQGKTGAATGSAAAHASGGAAAATLSSVGQSAGSHVTATSPWRDLLDALRHRAYDSGAPLTPDCAPRTPVQLAASHLHVEMCTALVFLETVCYRCTMSAAQFHSLHAVHPHQDDAGRGGGGAEAPASHNPTNHFPSQPQTPRSSTTNPVALPLSGAVPPHSPAAAMDSDLAASGDAFTVRLPATPTAAPPAPQGRSPCRPDIPPMDTGVGGPAVAATADEEMPPVVNDGVVPAAHDDGSPSHVRPVVAVSPLEVAPQVPPAAPRPHMTVTASPHDAAPSATTTGGGGTAATVRQSVAVAHPAARRVASAMGAPTRPLLSIGVVAPFQAAPTAMAAAMAPPTVRLPEWLEEQLPILQQLGGDVCVDACLHGFALGALAAI